MTIKRMEAEAMHQNGPQRAGSTATINQTGTEEEGLREEGEEGRGRRRGRRRRRIRGERRRGTDGNKSLDHLQRFGDK